MITRDFVSRTTLIRNVPSLPVMDSAWCLTAHVIGLSAKHTDHQSHYFNHQSDHILRVTERCRLDLGVKPRGSRLDNLYSYIIMLRLLNSSSNIRPHVLIRRRYLILLGVIQPSDGRIQHHTSHKQPLMIIYFEFQIGPCLSCLIFWGL